jgi:hypothetical protein
MLIGGCLFSIVKVIASPHHQYQRIHGGAQLVGLLECFLLVHSVILDWDLGLANTSNPLRLTADLNLPQLRYLNLRLRENEDIEDLTIETTAVELGMHFRHLRHPQMTVFILKLVDFIDGMIIVSELQHMTRAFQNMRFPNLSYFESDLPIEFESLPSVPTWVSPSNFLD